MNMSFKDPLDEASGGIAAGGSLEGAPNRR